MTVTPKPARSRLDPEPMPRRDFLGLASLATTAGALLFAFVGMLRLPRAAVLPAPTRTFSLTLPESLAPGVAFEPVGRNVAVFRDADGGVYAISKICTHLGCIVKPSPTGFDCPCHGSKFAPDGSVVKGPAPTSLPWLQISGEQGSYIVDESVIVTQGTRVNA